MLASFNILALVAIASVVSAAPTPDAGSKTTGTSGVQYFGDSESTGGKAGLAYPKSSMCTDLFDSKKISWGYNWEGVRDGLPDHINEFVPTCRGGKNSQLCDAMTNLDGVKYIFSFNEPDKVDQDKFDEPLGSYSKAIAMWNEKLQPHSGKYRLGAPAVSNSQIPGEGIDYLRGFLKACTDCTIDFINLHWHWYAPLTGQEYFDQFQAYIKGVHEEFPDKDIWIAEFSAQQGSVQDIAQFLKLAMQWMDETKYIVRYAYFMAAPGNPASGAMASPDGHSLNPVGQVYNTY